MKAIADKQIILVVDDTPANIEVAHHTLKDTYIVKIATSGAKALNLAKVLPQPDLILLDVMMPEMDGYEVCIGLKSDPSTSDIPIIFLTGKIDAEDETRGLELGAIDYIHKPFSPLVVQARVRTHLACAKPASSWRTRNAKWIEFSTTFFRRRQSRRLS